MMRNLLLFFLSLWSFTSHANNDCSNAIALTPGITCSNTTGTFSGATLTGAAPSCATESIQDVWYKFTATDVSNGIYLNAVNGLNHGLEVRQGGCNGTVVACRNDYFAGYGESYFGNNFVVGQEYYIRVFNVTAQFTTASFTICVQKFPTPANDLCSNAQQLTPGNVTCTLTPGTFSGSLNNGANPSCAASASQDVWYKFTATDVTMSVYVDGVQYLNHGFELYQGGCNGTLVVCKNDYTVDGYSESYFNNNFIVGQEYFVRVFNASATLTTRSFNICVQKFPTPANDLCANAQQLTPGNVTCTLTPGTFSGSVKDGGIPSCAASASQDVWYKFTATDVTMSVYISDDQYLNHGFEVYQGGCNGTLIKCKNDYNANGYSESYFNNNFIVGQEYYVRVFNASATLTTRSFNICIQKFPTPANDLCANAQQLTPGNVTCTLTSGTFSGSLNNGANPSCAASASQDVWYKFTATDVTMSVYVSDDQYLNHGFEIYQGGCNGTLITCKNDYNANGYSESYFNNNFIVGQEYYVRVFNASGTLTTRSFNICIQKFPTPANDVCANAQQLTPGNVTCTLTSGTFSGSLMDGGVPSCATSASQDVWYKFTASDVTMSVYVSDDQYLNHGFEIYQGSCNGTLIMCKNDYNSNGYGESYFNNNFIVGQEYYVRVFNASGTLTTRNFGICIQKFPTPANDLCANAQQLTPGTACTYTLGTFSGSVMDGGVPSCAATASQDVWYKFTASDAMISIELDGTSNLNHGFEVYQGGCSGTFVNCTNFYAAGTGESYFSTTFIPGQEYYIRVINASGALSTRNFNICVRKYPTPSNDLCANATEVFPGTTCTYTGGTFSGSLNDGTAQVCPSGTTVQDIWYKFTATEQTYSIYLNPIGGFNPGFQIFEGSCSGIMVACVNNLGNNASEYYQNYNFVIGQTYYVRFFHLMGGYASQNISFCITKYPKPVNDTCENATVLYQKTTCMEVGATLSGAMFDGPAISCAPQAGQDVWFRFIAEGSSANIYIGPMLGRDLGYQVLQGGCNGTTIACINTNGTNLSESATIPNLTQGQEYYIRVFNAFAGPTIDSFSICVYGAIQPCNASVSIAASVSQICAGQQATFTATPVNGGATPQYQWKRNGSNVGTNSPTFSASNLANGDIITVVMTSSVLCPSTPVVTSNAVSMTVNDPSTPAFTQIPAICPGSGFTLPTTSNNGITGTWSPAVNNTATTTYTFTPNIGQCAISTTMTVTVNGNIIPTFTQVPAICSGGNFTLPSTSLNGITGTWSPAANNTATTTYTFTPTAGQCASTAMMTVVVNSNATPAFTQVAAICSGGSFTLPATSNNGITGTWSPAINNAATTTYIFTPHAGQCAISASMTVVVNNNVTPTFTQIAPICQGGTFTLPTTSNNGINGTWSPAVNNTATTTYVFMPNAGECAVFTTMTVNVTNGVTPTFTQVPAICSGGSFTLPTVSNNGISGTWSPAVNNNTTTTYTFTPNAGQCASTATMTVSVNNNVAPSFNQIAAICPGGSFTLPTVSNNGISGTWSPAVNNNATTTYTFTPNAGQCASTATMTVSVNNNVAPSFNQISAICPGGSFTLPTVSNNGITGTWSPAVNNNATTTYTFTPNAGQCASTATMTVAVNNVNAGVTVTGATITATLSGASYQWINCNDGQQIDGATAPSFTATANGSYAVIVTQNGCQATSQCVTITDLGNETFEHKGWKIYPNPVIEQLFIETDEAVDIVITDMTGKTISTQALVPGTNVVNTASLSAGMYFITSANRAHAKFIKR